MKAACICIIVVMCVLPILMVNSCEIHNSPTRYRWVDYTIDMWHNPGLVTVRTDRRYSYVVARTTKIDSPDELPSEGEIDVKDGEIEFSRVNLNENDRVINKVLLIENGRHKWIPSSGGIVERNAIVGGNLNNKTIYICRFKIVNHYTGYMQPDIGKCCLSFDSCHESYDLLIHEL